MKSSSGMPVRCITTSLNLARTLGESSHGEGTAEVFLTGGYLYPQSGLLIGPQAKSNLDHYHADYAFLSAAGVSIEGIFNANELVVENERSMIANADRVIILADHSKIGQKTLAKFAPLSATERLITDEGLSEVWRYQLAEAGLTVELAPGLRGAGNPGGD